MAAQEEARKEYESTERSYSLGAPALVGSNFGGQPYGGMPRDYALEASLPPSPFRRFSDVRSFFSDERVEMMRLLLGTKMRKGEARIDLPENMVRVALAWAREHQGRFRC